MHLIFSKSVQKIASDIRFWVLLFFIVRLIGITNPPLENSHSWRQAFGLIISRSFFEYSQNIFFPVMDFAFSSIRKMCIEFPVINYLHYCLSLVFGYEHWYGRLINLVASSAGLFFFFRLVRYFFQSSFIATAATLLLASSIWFSFSRKMMPDTFSISLVFAGLWFGVQYSLRHGPFYLLFFFVFVSTGLLVKIPSILYLIPFSAFLLFKGREVSGTFYLFTSIIISVSIGLGWYFFWCGKLAEYHGSEWIASERPFITGIKEVIIKYRETLGNFTFHAFQGYIGFLLFILGVLIAFIKKELRLLNFLFLTGGSFLIFMFKAGWFFYHHNYYIFPFVPVMALFGAYALFVIRKVWIIAPILGISMTESLWNQRLDFIIPESEKYKMTLEKIMDEISSRNDQIITNGKGNPLILYLAHRDGWNCVDWEISEIRHIRKIITKDCKFIVIDRHANAEMNDLILPLKPAFENRDFRI